MLQQLLNALTSRVPHPSEPADPRETVQLAPVVINQAQPAVQPRVRSAPRSVCSSLKDLCEL